MIYKVVFNFGLVLITNEDILPKLRKTTENFMNTFFFHMFFTLFQILSKSDINRLQNNILKIYSFIFCIFGRYTQFIFCIKL